MKIFGFSFSFILMVIAIIFVVRKFGDSIPLVKSI